MIRAKLVELRHIVVFWGPFCSFSNFEFFVLRSGASEYLYENFREYSSFIFRFNDVFKNVISCVVWTQQRFLCDTRVGDFSDMQRGANSGQRVDQRALLQHRSSAIRITPLNQDSFVWFFICAVIIEFTKSGEFLNMVRNYKRKRDAVLPNEHSLKLAVYAVLVLSMPLRIAAREYGFCKSTLGDFDPKNSSTKVPKTRSSSIFPMRKFLRITKNCRFPCQFQSEHDPVMQ